MPRVGSGLITLRIDHTRRITPINIQNNICIGSNVGKSPANPIPSCTCNNF